MIDLEKLSSPMTSVNAQVKNSPVDGGVRNMVGLTTSKENLKMKTTSAVDADKKAVSSAKNSPNHCVNSEQSSKNHEHNQEQNGFVTLVNKECSSKGKPTHDSEMAALGEKNCRNSKENAVLPVNSDSHLKESKDADELRKVLENVEHDVNLDNLKMKSSCIESQKTSDAIENSVRTIASVTNNSQKAKENVFDKFQNMVKSAECDANTLHENLVKDSVDELDDISIDLTEEEEEALLRPDPDVDLNVSKGSNNSKGNQASSKSSVSTSTEQKLKVTCGKKADGVADEKCSSDSVAEVIPVDAIYDVPKGKDVDSKSEAMEVVNETEDVPLDKEAEYKTTKVGGDSVASEESAKPEIQTLIPERLSSKDNLGECSELKRKLTLDDEKQVEKLGLTVKKVKLDSEPKSEDAKPVDISKSILLSRLKSNDSSVKKEKCCIKLSKQELEDLNAKMITLYLTESERSDIAALKAKCESLEKCLEDWKRKAKGAQIQNVELKIALQRAIHQRKEKPGGPGQIVKVSTRTVGLQVQMQSFLVPDEKQRLQGTRPTNVKYLPPTVVPVPVSNPPPIGFPKVQFPPGGLPTTAAAAALKPGSNLMSPIGAVATRMVNPQGKSGVSILQPRLIASQASLSPVAAVNGIPRVASVTTPTSSTPVRALLDSRRVQAMNASSAHPVPMRLVPNQAVTKQVNPTPRVPVPVCQPAQTVVSTTTTVASTTAATTVKIIDLTADEDENLAANQLHATNIISPSATLVTTSTPSTLMGGKTMALVGPITTSASASNGQLIIGGPVKGPVTPVTVPAPILRVDNAVRAQAPPPPLTSAPGARLTYLVPTSMVRGPSVFVTQPNQVQMQPRPAATTWRQPVQTFVLQKGAALVPVSPPGQLSAVGTLQSVAPATIRNSAPVTTMRMTTPAVPIQSTVAFHRPPAPSVVPPVVPPVRTAGPIIAPVTKLSQVSSVQAAAGDKAPVQDVVVSKYTPKHPAALPRTFHANNDDQSLKGLPPRPALKISKVNNGIVLSWNMCQNMNHADVASYQLYAYQESNQPPSTALWKKVGDVKALPLPMACTLTQFMEGHKYHFAVRAVDVHARSGEFSEPASIVLGTVSAATIAKTQ